MNASQIRACLRLGIYVPASEIEAALRDDYGSDLIDRAKAFWVEREQGFPRFVRQSWEQGTDLAKEAAIREVMRHSDGSRNGLDGDD